MTRKIERIEVVLDIIKDAWMKNPDMRLSQLLLNTWMDYHTEEQELVARVWSVYDVDTMYWGTRGITWAEPLKYKKLSELSVAHIENILRTQEISMPTRLAMYNELLSRDQSSKPRDKVEERNNQKNNTISIGDYILRFK